MPDLALKADQVTGSSWVDPRVLGNAQTKCQRGSSETWGEGMCCVLTACASLPASQSVAAESKLSCNPLLAQSCMGLLGSVFGKNSDEHRFWIGSFVVPEV